MAEPGNTYVYVVVVASGGPWPEMEDFDHFTAMFPAGERGEDLALGYADELAVYIEGLAANNRLEEVPEKGDYVRFYVAVEDGDGDYLNEIEIEDCFFLRKDVTSALDFVEAYTEYAQDLLEDKYEPLKESAEQPPEPPAGDEPEPAATPRKRLTYTSALVPTQVDPDIIHNRRVKENIRQLGGTFYSYDDVDNFSRYMAHMATETWERVHDGIEMKRLAAGRPYARFAVEVSSVEGDSETLLEEMAIDAVFVDKDDIKSFSNYIVDMSRRIYDSVKHE